MSVNAAQASVKTVGDPNAAYESLKSRWDRNRAVCSGEQYVKDFDGRVSIGDNLLIPFSPSMSPLQYKFYKAEAELPGVVAQFSKMLVGGLLRKKPELTFKKPVPDEAKEWILHDFGADGCSLSAFMDAGLFEEMQTSRAWIFVDYPKRDLEDDPNPNDKPYPVLHKAEAIINWRVKTTDGKKKLDRVIVRGFVQKFVTNEFHPDFIDTVWVHELNEKGQYQIRTYEASAKATNVVVTAGQQLDDPTGQRTRFDLIDETVVVVNGEPLDMIPAWPLNGTIEVYEPMLSAFIDKEISLYNKISRRNHLLYGAASYTPVLSTNMADEKFNEIVAAGLGSWLKLEQGDTADILKTPTEALKDYAEAIAAGFEELARLGIRMLSPEVEQSGVALEIRNASQTAQLGTLNTKVSMVLRQIIVFMINWRYRLDLTVADVEFSLSADFNPVPLGADWLRLATEWYQQGLIPRSSWLIILKQNDMISPDYDDEKGQQEIIADAILANAMTAQNAGNVTEGQ